MSVYQPAYLHGTKSYLHMIAKDMVFYEHYLKKAMEQPDDPIRKLKYIALAIVCSIHLKQENGTKSPLNPALGETL